MIEGVLFDSGGVLVRPKGDRWWPRWGFEEAVLRHFPSAAFTELDRALEPALAYAHSVHGNEDWHEFYRIVVEGLGLPASRALLDELVAFDPAEVVELYDDVVPCLAALRERGVRMAVVSDAWPNLRDMHRKLGIGSFFEGHAISAEVGCTKPDPRMYAAGAEVLGLPPESLVFVDDSPELVEAAMTLGYHGVALRRSGESPTSEIPWVKTLDEFGSRLDRM